MTFTKSTLVAIAVAAATLASQPQARAAETTPPTAPSSGDRLAALRERMQETARELKLTPEQTAKLQTIVRERAEKLRQLRQDTTLSPEEKRQRLMTARAELVSEVKKTLTPEQFAIWKAHQGEATGRPARPLARLQQAINDLNLTDDQKEQLKPLYQEQMDKLRELYLDANLSIAEKLDKLKAIRQDAAPKLKKVLSAQQYATLERDVQSVARPDEAAPPGPTVEPIRTLLAQPAAGLPHDRLEPLQHRNPHRRARPAIFSHHKGKKGLIIANRVVAAFVLVAETSCAIFQPLCYAHLAPRGR